MDYEKAYKAVLQTATQWIKDGCTDKEKICLECIFPELRESEDERIRRELIEYLKGDLDDITTDDTDRWIAYLEKQKEYHIPWYDYQKSKEAGYTIVPNEEYEQLIKQKEQKPASISCGHENDTEWSEVDELMRTAVIQTLERFGGRGTTGVQIDWLKSLRPSWKPSEDHVEAVRYFVNKHQSEAWAATSQWKQFTALRGLLDILQKLM